MSINPVGLVAVLCLTGQLVACATTATTPVDDVQTVATTVEQSAVASDTKSKAEISHPVASQLITGAPSRKDTITDNRLAEVSGIAAASDDAILFWAINDSGNSNSIFAIGHDGAVLHEYQIPTKNRDWESLSRTAIAGKPFLIIGDTGDNLRHHKRYKLHFIAEPAPGDSNTVTTLPIHNTIEYRYPDGSHNVEAMAAIGDSIYLITKQPLRNNQRSAGKLYRLPVSNTSGTEIVAQSLGEMVLLPSSLTSRLAASLAGIDLDQATDLVFSANRTAAYLLTYRQIIRFQRQAEQTWGDVLLAEGEVIHTHGLRQAEAITASEDGVLWLTSEKLPAPIWSIPTQTLFE